MYDELEGIDYVIYLSNNDNKLHITDLTDRTTTTENTGNPWYKDAYGNCLIDLRYAHVTDKLYLVTEDVLRNLKVRDNEKNIKFLEKNADIIITA